MRELIPAWPPGASRSMITVFSPSDAPYTAAANSCGATTDDCQVVEVSLRTSSQANLLRHFRRHTVQQFGSVRKEHHGETAGLRAKSL